VKEYEMKVLVGDITKLMNVDVIVNAANGVGIMGAGLAGAIGRSAGQEFLDAVRKIAKDSGPSPNILIVS
jgi:O-acetyl-ADP-ribose deacetylase (regulator of RNase III)